MIVGQSAGATAAMAIAESVAVQAVSYDKLHRCLREAGQVLNSNMLEAARPSSRLRNCATAGRREPIGRVRLREYTR